MESSETRAESDAVGEPFIARDSESDHNPISRREFRHNTVYTSKQKHRRFLSHLRGLLYRQSTVPFGSDNAYQYVSTDDQYESFQEQGVQQGPRSLKNSVSRMIVSNIKLFASMMIVPAALIVGVIKVHPAAAFSLNLAAVIPLSVALTMATESLSRDLGPTAGALLNISCGNLAEIIILYVRSSILLCFRLLTFSRMTALSEGHVRIVQASLLGSLLVNLLLVLGLSLVVAGMAYNEQTYDDTSAQLFIGQLNLTVFSFILPTAFYGAMSKVTDADHASIAFSRAVSLILLIVYIIYLTFHLRSQQTSSEKAFEMDQNAQNRSERASEIELPPLPKPGPHTRWKSSSLSAPPTFDYRHILSKPATSSFPFPRHSLDHVRSRASDASRTNDDPESQEEQRPADRPTWMSRIFALATLIASTIVIGICADTVVANFRTLNERGTLRESFVGLIILPVAGNIAEVITSAMVAAKGEIDLAINVAVGSAIQIGLMVTPLTVLAGWAMGKNMSLHFNGFETVAIVAASLMVSFLLVRGKANHFEGIILIASYAGVSIGALLLPDSR
ncbi:hypothetical protein BGW36DRAFT_422782 [Talaromyces proteolyticus]|uniref:Sodium/calcium exchanger membrane region domain-containing protein n=1 Tax=Talaromyces proteolyticus TaxID=1131652 RepID=A0AAD4KYZ3_9EURO|nr:uncharacterized protein BGW36DRAFT_422782 [Talaromyces proteolyticus]KAH8703214.1 hypothetical protein BGW36DRAFT_422782 [Talaromyces proteolyticus]